MKTITINRHEDVPDNFTGKIILAAVPEITHIITLLNGKEHSYNDEPAYITPYEWKFWFMNGKKHRGNGQPAIIDEKDNVVSYYINGEEVREESAKVYALLFGEKEQD